MIPIFLLLTTLIAWIFPALTYSPGNQTMIDMASNDFDDALVLYGDTSSSSNINYVVANAGVWNSTAGTMTLSAAPQYISNMVLNNQHQALFVFTDSSTGTNLYAAYYTIGATSWTVSGSPILSLSAGTTFTAAPVLSMDQNGNVLVAYISTNTGISKVSVLFGSNGGSGLWTGGGDRVTGTATQLYDFLGAGLDDSGNALVSWLVADSSDSSFKIDGSRFSSSVWSSVSIFEPTGTGVEIKSCQVALNRSSSPQAVATFHWTDGTNDYVGVKNSIDGGQNWGTVTIPNRNYSVAIGILDLQYSLCLNDVNQAVVLFSDGIGATLQVGVWDGSAWNATADQVAGVAFKALYRGSTLNNSGNILMVTNGKVNFGTISGTHSNWYDSYIQTNLDVSSVPDIGVALNSRNNAVAALFNPDFLYIFRGALSKTIVGQIYKNYDSWQTDIYNVISWMPMLPKPDCYRILRDNQVIATVSGDTLSYEDHYLSAKTTYTYEVDDVCESTSMPIGNITLRTRR